MQVFSVLCSTKGVTKDVTVFLILGKKKSVETCATNSLWPFYLCKKSRTLSLVIIDLLGEQGFTTIKLK